MTALIIYLPVRTATNAQLEDWAWQLDFDKCEVETRILELDPSDTLTRLDFEEELYSLTRDPFYIDVLKELDKRGMDNPLCLRTN